MATNQYPPPDNQLVTLRSHDESDFTQSDDLEDDVFTYSDVLAKGQDIK